MKNFKFIHYLTVALILSCNSLHPQSIDDKSIVVFPFASKGYDQTVLISAASLLRNELQKQSTYTVVSEQSTMEALKGFYCEKIECATQIGIQLNSKIVVMCDFLNLGQKLIVNFSVIDVVQKKVVLIDNITSMSVEDLDQVMKRIAASVITLQPISKSVEIGNIVESESQAPKVRGSRGFYGISFGYLFPVVGYPDDDRSFTMDFRAGGEIENFDYGIQLFAREGFGINIFSSLLATKTDFCPYIGAGLGFHWIQREEGGDYWAYNSSTQTSYMVKREEKKGDGLELLINSGIRMFHTFKFRITINLSYSITFNDFNSNALVFTIGILN
jgi:TolB-like protein